MVLSASDFGFVVAGSEVGGANTLLGMTEPGTVPIGGAMIPLAGRIRLPEPASCKTENAS
jgi:hypothetical protein